jgi:hypothetical protein
MLIQIVSFVATILVIIVAGVKLGDTIKDLKMKIFFWILYGVSILTFILLVICCYIYYVFRRKGGPIGPRGFQGEPGDLGDPGSCDQNLCRSRTIAIMIEKIIENEKQKPVSIDIKKKIMAFVDVNKDKFNKWDLKDVKIFKELFIREFLNNKGDLDSETVWNKIIEGINIKFDDSKQLT